MEAGASEGGGGREGEEEEEKRRGCGRSYASGVDLLDFGQLSTLSHIGFVFF